MAVIVFAPVERLPPFSLTVAVDPASAAVPTVVPARVNTTLPVGTVLLPGTVTVAVKVVLAVAVMLAGFAVTAVAVATDTGVTVTVAVALEPRKALLAPKLAVIVLLPRERLLALTSILALEPESVASPRVLLPNVKVTFPAGAALPLAAFTVAVNMMVWIDTMFDDDATRAVVVATGGGVTVTLTEPLELRNPVPPV